MSLETLAGVSLQQLLDQAGNPARMLRSLPALHYKMPFEPEYTTWRDEQRAWKQTSVLYDQSHHMTDLYVKGPDVKRLFSDLAVNSFAGFGKDKAKQFVACNDDGYVISDASCLASTTTNTCWWARRSHPTGCNTMLRPVITTSAWCATSAPKRIRRAG